jgi:hypothetical protein
MKLTKMNLRQVVHSLLFDPYDPTNRVIYESDNPAVYLAQAIAELKMMQLTMITTDRLRTAVRLLVMIILIMTPKTVTPKEPNGKA